MDGLIYDDGHDGPVVEMWDKDNGCIYVPTGDFVFEEFKDHYQVHCDEKWFIIMQNGKKVRVYPDADGGYTMPGAPKVQSKKWRSKVMAFTAVGRPVYDGEECVFDGKVGIQFATKERKIKQGKNKGEVRLDDVSVDGKVSRTFLSNVFDQIYETMPHAKGLHKKITIQWDGAPGHSAAKTKARAKALCTLARKKGWNIVVQIQPPQSPDLNINDMQVYKIMSADVAKNYIKNKVMLQEQIQKTWDEMDVKTISRAWVNFYHNCKLIFMARGGNDFRHPHTGLRKAFKDCWDVMDMPAMAFVVDENEGTFDANKKIWQDWHDRVQKKKRRGGGRR